MINMVTKKSTSKVRTVHICSQEETLARHTVLLERLSVVTLGNGTPENGLLFMFRAFLEEEKRKKEDIAEIKKDLKDSLDSSQKAIKALDIYKAEMEGLDTGIRETEEKENIAKALHNTKARDNWYKALTIIGIACAIYFGFKNSKKTDTIEAVTNKTQNNIENLGVPIVTRNGKILALPDSTHIQFFANDSLSYTIKRDK